jgi:hypothetical protein
MLANPLDLEVSSPRSHLRDSTNLGCEVEQLTPGKLVSTLGVVISRHSTWFPRAPKVAVLRDAIERRVGA